MELLREFPKRRYVNQIVVPFLVCCVFFNTFFPVTFAGPEGAQVVNGEASFLQNGNKTVITASDKSIINYSSFDIAQPETVQFIQPSSNASVLNRILSANPTNIDGQLLANGRVFFVNPAGIIIGESARINVNQLVASALNISNSDFVNGRYNFVGGEGSVINRGDISAESAYFVGQQVANSGNINCPTGCVVMAAGDRVFLGEPGSDNVVVEIDPPSLPDATDPAEGTAVLNEGTVDAAGGTIVLAAAGDVYSLGISNVGSLSASTEISQAGKVELTAPGGKIRNTGSIKAKSDSDTGGTIIAEGAEVVNSGTVDVTGSEGGHITMEASARLGQFGTIHADATEADGGTIDLWAGDVVALSSDSLTTANAGLNGNGGEITVFSPDTALFWPDAGIEAKGGSESGDGGFVEISGKEHIEIYGLVDTSAPHGASGTFLIDPTYNVSLTDATDINGENGSWIGSATSTWEPNAPNSMVNADAQLAFSDVIITTYGYYGTGTDQEGNISVDQTITDATGNSLTLKAANDIYLNRDINLSGGPGDLHLTADWAPGDVSPDGTGAIFNNGGTITVGSGDFEMRAGDGIGTSAAPIATNVETLHAFSRTGNIYVKEADDVALYDVRTFSGSISLEATNGRMTSIGDSIILAGGSTLTMKQAASLNTDDFYFGNQAGTDLILHSTGGSVTSDYFETERLNGADEWRSIMATANNDILLRGYGDIKLGGNVTSTNGVVRIISDLGGVYDAVSYYSEAVSNTLDNIAITGFSNTIGAGIVGGLIDPPGDAAHEAAIVIKSYNDLKLGSSTGTALIANGAYNPALVNDGPSVGFGPEGGAIDVAIYLRSSGNVELGSVGVSINNSAGTGTLVVDADNLVTFGAGFNYSLAFGPISLRRIDAISRISTDLTYAIAHGTLPYANNPAAIFGTPEGAFGGTSGGTYVLRGSDFIILDMAVAPPRYSDSWPWLNGSWWYPTLPPDQRFTPDPQLIASARSESESEDYGEVERDKVRAAKLVLKEEGLGDLAGLARAFRPSLNTDLYLYRVAERIVELRPTLVDKGGRAIAELDKVVIEILTTTDGPFNAQTVTEGIAKSPEASLIGAWLNALTDYAFLLNTSAGYSVEESLGHTLQRYVDTLTLRLNDDSAENIELFLRAELMKSLGG